LRQINGEITVHTGPEHDYLGMALTCHPEQKWINLNMSKYVEGCIEEFEQEHAEQSIKVVTTPATKKNVLRKDRNRESTIIKD
jgi:hypothetical protein